MKPTSFRNIALAMTALILCSAFTAQTPATPKMATPAAQNTHYYWYYDDGDGYDSWNNVADEITRQQNLTGAYVNTSQFGGILLVKGYTNNDYPHSLWPSYFLYAHF